MRKPTAAPSLGAIDPIKQAAFLDRGSAPGGRGSAAWREMEIPSANLHGTALGLAKMLGVVANGGVLDGRSVLSAGTLEASNVDLAQEFTNMIRFQRAYSASSKIITTVDDMLQEVSNLKR